MQASEKEIIRCVQDALIQKYNAENKFNNVTGDDLDIAIAELNAAEITLGRYLKLAKESNMGRQYELISISN